MYRQITRWIAIGSCENKKQARRQRGPDKQTIRPNAAIDSTEPIVTDKIKNLTQLQIRVTKTSTWQKTAIFGQWTDLVDSINQERV